MGPTPIPTQQDDDIRLNKDVAAFSYIWIMAVLIYASRRDSRFVQFHAKQAMVLFLLSFVWILPWVGQYLALLVVGLMILGFINAALGQYRSVPLVGNLVDGTWNVRDLSKLAARNFKNVESFVLHPGSETKEALPSEHSLVQAQPPNLPKA